MVTRRPSTSRGFRQARKISNNPGRAFPGLREKNGQHCRCRIKVAASDFRGVTQCDVGGFCDERLGTVDTLGVFISLDYFLFG